MSGTPSDATPKMPCPCTACFAPCYGTPSHTQTSQAVGPVSHFESMKTLAAERPMVNFNPSSVGFQPLGFPYPPLGLMPPLQHRGFSSPFHHPRFPEESGFGDIATDLTKKQTSSTQQLPRNFWSAHARGVPERPRRIRTVFSPPQLEQLEKEFKVQQYIGSAQRTYIASHLGLTETQVKVWFQNRRIRWRKQNLASAATE